MASFLAGCGIKPAPVTTCAQLDVIRPSRLDHMTLYTRQQIVAINTSLQRLKGLPLPKKKPQPSK